MQLRVEEHVPSMVRAMTTVSLQIARCASSSSSVVGTALHTACTAASCFFGDAVESSSSSRDSSMVTIPS